MRHCLLVGILHRPGRRKATERHQRLRLLSGRAAEVIDRLGTRVTFILGVHGDLGRQIPELIADVPAAVACIPWSAVRA